MSIYSIWGYDYEPPEEKHPEADKAAIAPAREVKIYIGGDLTAIHTVCRFFCADRMCVTITPTTFMYAGGSETGASIGLINYARFPESAEDLDKKAFVLAKKLMNYCCQKSCSICTPTQSYFLKNPQFENAR